MTVKYDDLGVSNVLLHVIISPPCHRSILSRLITGTQGAEAVHENTTALHQTTK